jgi:hypothetical protein
MCQPGHNQHTHRVCGKRDLSSHWSLPAGMVTLRGWQTCPSNLDVLCSCLSVYGVQPLDNALFCYARWPLSRSSSSVPRGTRAARLCTTFWPIPTSTPSQCSLASRPQQKGLSPRASKPSSATWKPQTSCKRERRTQMSCSASPAQIISSLCRRWYRLCGQEVFLTALHLHAQLLRHCLPVRVQQGLCGAASAVVRCSKPTLQHSRRLAPSCAARSTLPGQGARSRRCAMLQVTPGVTRSWLVYLLCLAMGGHLKRTGANKLSDCRCACRQARCADPHLWHVGARGRVQE